MATALIGIETFDGVAGESLSRYIGRVPNQYFPWTYISGTAPLMTSAGRVRANSAVAGCIYYTNVTPASANYEVEARIKCVTNVGTVGVWGRGLISATTYYEALYDSANVRWELRRLAAGTPTSLGTSAQTLRVGDEYIFSLRMNGTTIELTVNGAVLISVTDSNLTDRGYIGLGFGPATGAADTVGQHLTEVRVYNLDAETDITNALTVADFKRICDPMAGLVKDFYPTFGNGEPLKGQKVLSEQVNRWRRKVQGDGATDYGLRNSALKNALTSPMMTIARAARGDYMFQQYFSQFLTTLNNDTRSGIPSEWSASGITNLLDAYLLRLNGFSGTVAPSTGGAWTPTAITGGALPTMLAVEAPRIKFSYVSTNWYNESPPSSASNQVALPAGKNAYRIPAALFTPPTGVTAIRVYMQRRGASAAEAYGYVGDYEVTAGAANSTIDIVVSFNQLRFDINPPSWGQLLVPPDLAAAVSYALGQAGGGISDLEPISIGSGTMLTPENVALSNPYECHLGQRNPFDTAVYGRWTAGSYVEGLVPTANDTTLLTQGFAGATKLRAIVRKTIDSAITPQLSYKYYDETNGWGSLQTASGVSADAAFSSASEGAIAEWTLSAGRVVRQVHAITFTGLTYGEIDIVGVFGRDY